MVSLWALPQRRGGATVAGTAACASTLRKLALRVGGTCLFVTIVCIAVVSAQSGQRVRIPRLPETVIERIVGRFGTLQKVMRATIDDLDDVTGVGKARARAIKEGLSRLAETSILDRYT